jgi:hypothetical protein
VSPGWVAAWLAGGSLVVSMATLIIVLRVMRSTRRSEWAGNERLEILREQQQRLQVLREERRMLEKELEWRRSTMDQEERLLELNPPSEYPRDPENTGPTRTPTDAGEGQQTARERPFTQEEPERRGFWSRVFGR